MITALRLVHGQGTINNGSQGTIEFCIRDKIVSLNEVMKYFRRRPDYPNQEQEIWARVASINVEDPWSPDVCLITNYGASTSASGSNSFDETQSSDASSARIPGPASTALVLSTHGHGESDSPNSMGIGTPVSSPDDFAITEHMISLAFSYCDDYFSSLQALNDVEPDYHKDEPHAIFASGIQDGVFHLLRFQQNHFELPIGNHFVKVLGADTPSLSLHPMCFVQIIAVAIELMAARSRTSLADDSAKHSILDTVIGMLFTFLERQAWEIFGSAQGQHPLTTIFSQLSNSTADVQMHLLLKIVQRMVGFCGSGALSGTTHSWKAMYLKERYADCLYHAGVSGERHKVRSELLEEQRQFYGDSRRNVLWTAINVAQDHLEKNQVMEAEAMFHFILKRAEDAPVEFDRSKSRFAALEGLAETETLAASLEANRARGALGRGLSSYDTKRLEQAATYLHLAEKVARKSFGEKSRRTIRVQDKRLTLQKRIKDHASIFCMEIV